MKKVNPIHITTSDGKEYTLEFNRQSVLYAEEHGFNMAEMESKPMNSLTNLIVFSFRMHQPTMSRSAIIDIIDNEIGGLLNLPKGFAERLAELYIAPFEVMSENPTKATITM